MTPEQEFIEDVREMRAAQKSRDAQATASSKARAKALEEVVDRRLTRIPAAPVADS